ncbi:MAG: UDP-N-acetylglucosamine 1-carboxyvinyltransferase [Puniceicoccales bacterium]|jgi:UDP-N-acetylglucosamine 1-carboxyvinyltransferase|nr:UDP-N-acetylglucosamine 1-carboxyvinyltransferase [Puniceicoccales bacterium]
MMNIARIVGGGRLSGSVNISGSKNASFPVMAASLLTEEACLIHNIPRLSDTDTMVEILRSLGAEVVRIGEHSLKIQASRVMSEVPAPLMRKIRGSICLMGALVGRLGKATIAVPGGCSIGDRPIDLHIKGFRALGCIIEEKDDILKLDGSNLRGTTVCLRGARGSTMTGTVNVIMVALRADGETTIESAAIEPEVTDFCRYLTQMGAKIDGIGTSTLKIVGKVPLHGCEYAIIKDRLEAGTFICAGLITGGSMDLHGLQCGFLDVFFDKLREMGADVSQSLDGTIRVRSSGQLAGTMVNTQPYPGFPTDLQAQICALLTQSRNDSVITEEIYPGRFLYTSELQKMGAKIDVASPCAHVHGNSKLSGARVEATDLRASAALYLAGLCAQGETFVGGVHHLDRGYENFEAKLCSLGAQIERMEA